LTDCFDEIEKESRDTETLPLLRDLSIHLRKLPFPNRPFRPLMQFCLRTWSSPEIESRDAAKCLDIMKKINNLRDQAADILIAYDELSIDPMIQDGPIELAYGDFRRQMNGVLPDGTELPYSLAKAREVDKRGELAILQMQKLATLYDGVTNLWDLLQWAPNYDLIGRFEKFTASQKYFLVSGFRAKLLNEMEKEKEEEGNAGKGKGIGGNVVLVKLIEKLEEMMGMPRRNVDNEVNEIGERLSKMHEEAKLMTPDRRRVMAAKSSGGTKHARTPTGKIKKWSTTSDSL
jgi:hypothetical protein